MDLSFAVSARTWGSLDQTQFPRLHLLPLFKESPFDQEPEDSMLWPPSECAPTPEIPVLFLFLLKTLFISEIQQLLPKFLWCLLNLIYFAALWKSYFSSWYQHLLDVLRGLSVGFCVCSCWIALLNFFFHFRMIWRFLFFFFLKKKLAKGWAMRLTDPRT